MGDEARTPNSTAAALAAARPYRRRARPRGPAFQEVAMLAECGINYEIFGKEGKHILCMHGWGGNMDSFKPLTRDLSGSARLIAVDFPGHGRSPEPDGVWQVDEFKAQILALLDEIGAPRVDIVAHSFGGRVALMLAAENPERVGRMVLTGCAGLLPRRSGGLQFKQAVFSALKAGYESAPVQKLLGKNADKLTSMLQSKLGSADYRALSGDMRRTFVNVINQDLEWCLSRIQASTLLFWGENDTATPLWMGQTMEKEIPDAGLVVMPGATHFAYLERYANFLAVVRQFFGV